MIMEQKLVLEKKKKLSAEAEEQLKEFMESFEDIKHGRVRRVVWRILCAVLVVQ